jgi:hypothetical protein
MVLGRKLQSNLSALYSPPASNSTRGPNRRTHSPASTSLSDALQTLISTYLLHALVILSHKFQSQCQVLWDTFQSTPTLLPHLPSLQPKHRDSMVTRAYSVLAKLPPLPCSPQPNHPNLIHARRSNYGRTRSSAFYTPPRAASSPIHSEIRLPGFASPSSVPPPPLLPFLLLSFNLEYTR